MSSETKQLLEDCTYANGCIPGTDCEGCAVEVTIMVVMLMMTVTMMMMMLMIMIVVADIIMIHRLMHEISSSHARSSENLGSHREVAYKLCIFSG